MLVWACWRALNPLLDGTSQREYPTDNNWLVVQAVDGYQPSPQVQVQVQVQAQPEARDSTPWKELRGRLNAAVRAVPDPYPAVPRLRA